MVLSEQSTGAVGLLQNLNLGSQQIHSLYMVMLLGSVAGLASSTLTIHPSHLFMPLVISLALMATGSVMDSFSSNLTRPGSIMRAIATWPPTARAPRKRGNRPKRN